jgi:hypothetical protein
MGKGCVRFKKLEDLALDVAGLTVARVPVEEHITRFPSARNAPGRNKVPTMQEKRTDPFLLPGSNGAFTRGELACHGWLFADTH